MNALQTSPTTLGVVHRELVIWWRALRLPRWNRGLRHRSGMLLSLWTEAKGSVVTASLCFGPGYHVRWVFRESKEISLRLTEKSVFFSSMAHGVVALALQGDSG